MESVTFNEMYSILCTFLWQCESFYFIRLKTCSLGIRIRTACDMQIDGAGEGGGGAGRPKLTWKKLTKRDCRE